MRALATRITRLAPATALCAAACGGGGYFNQSERELADRVSFFVSQVGASRPLPGFALAVVRDGRVIAEPAAGLRRLGGADSVTAATPFVTGALSHALVATAVLRLAADGRLHLDTPVTRYLPYFRLADGRQGEVTPRRLLSHTAGLPDLAYDWSRPEYDDGALERHVRSLARLRLVATPDSQFAHSGLGFDVLGDVIAKVTGTSFEDAMTRLVLAPLGMRHSTFRPAAPPPPEHAAGHRGLLEPRADTALPYTRARAPSAMLRSSAADLARFAVAVLAGARGGGPAILPDSLRNLMLTPRIAVDADVQMALGWYVRLHARDRMVVAHGATPGFGAALALVPDRGVGVAVLKNHDAQSPGEMVELAAGMLDLGLRLRAAVPKVSAAVPVARVLATRGAEQAAGTYRGLFRSGDARYSYEPADMVALGEELRRTGRVAEAISLFTANSQMHPDYFGSFRALALAYLELADTVRAIESWRTMLALEPERRGCPASCYRDPAMDRALAKR